MWMLVFFDLPVVEAEERKAATGFRKALLDQGFSMAQYSVYYKMLPDKEAVPPLVARLKKSMPEEGKVEILCITDRQYEDIQCFRGTERAEDRKNPGQLRLF